MIRISYKALYLLFERYYLNRSLEGYINDYIPPDVFQSSILMAHTLEDYLYLQTMVTDKSRLSNEYAIFVKDGELPLTIKRNSNVSLFQFAVLQTQSIIPIEEFIQVIESICDGRKIDSDSEVLHFRKCVSIILAPITSKEEGKGS